MDKKRESKVLKIFKIFFVIIMFSGATIVTITMVSIVMRMRVQEEHISNIIVSPRFEATTISAGDNHTIAINSDGTVVTANFGGLDWQDIVAVSSGTQHIVGLKSDGTTIAAGSNEYGQLEVLDWYDIIQVASGAVHTVGLRTDGTVVAAGQPHALGLAVGNMTAAVSGTEGWTNVTEWRDIIAIAAGGGYTAGLMSDGTVVATGWDRNNQVSNVRGWHEIIAISAGIQHTVGLKSDGTVISTRGVGNGDNIENWHDIVAISAGDWHTIGLQSDGTVVTTDWQQTIDGWYDIIAVAAGTRHSVGLRSDGTMVSVVSRDGPLLPAMDAVRRVLRPGFVREISPALDVTDWHNIKLPHPSQYSFEERYQEDA